MKKQPKLAGSMKKVAIALCIVCGFLFRSPAQYVTIPDASFVHWLNTNGYSTCLNGNLLDTSCFAVLNATKLNMNSSGIHDLTGIQYFKNLDSLDVGNTHITSFPQMPPLLTYLYCYGDSLISTANLPASLTTFNCGSNFLTSIILPPNLQILFCHSNQLTSLPALPNSLVYLECGYNTHLTSLPALPPQLYYLQCEYDSISVIPTLPSTLTTLSCGNSQVASLPSLPNSLQVIKCPIARLTSLPTLPTGLQHMECNNNSITALPAFPSQLNYFNCSYNAITSLPPFPQSLLYFKCISNQITILPAFPDSMVSFDCSGNPISCLPPITTINSLSFSGTNVRCIPNRGHVQTGYPGVDTMHLCSTTYDPNGCDLVTPIADAGPTSITVCNGATFQLNGSSTGGTAPFVYHWSPSTSVSFPDSTSTQASVTSSTKFYFTVTDSAGFSTTDSILVIVDNLVIDSIHVITTCTGQACVQITGGVGSLTYSWGGSFFNGPCLPIDSSGNYSIIVTDANGCSASASATASVSPPLTIDSLIVTDASCGLNNGSICAVISNAILPAIYTWGPPPLSGQCISNLAPGSYALTVTDNLGCTAGAFTTVGQSVELRIDSMPIQSISCAGSANGSTCVYVSGGSGSYIYYWSITNLHPQCVSNLSAGAYTVTVTDSLINCSVSSTATINLVNAISIGANVSTIDTKCYGNQDGTISALFLAPDSIHYSLTDSNYIAIPYGGTVADSTLRNFPNLYAGTYHLLMYDSVCSNIDYPIVIGQPSQLTLSFSANSDTIHFGVSDTITVTPAGGVPGYYYNWNNDTTQTIVVTDCNSYTVTITDANGCVFDSSYAIPVCMEDYVWPGDADFDGLADNNDLLPIGVGYGSTGPIRNNASLVWIGQPATDWANTQLNGANYKHIDCDGSGTIDADDTTAILLNYGQTHARGNGGPAPWRSGIPALEFTLTPDTLIDGEIINVSLSLGDSSNVATNVYGLAFTFNYDPLVIDSSLVNITFGNSWLCSNASDHINISKNFYDAGKLDVGLTRIDHTTRTGSGNIGTVAMRVTSGNINGKDLEYYTLKCFISNLVVIDNQGNHLQFNEGLDSAHLEYSPTGIRSVSADKVGLEAFPNPAYDQLTVKANAEMQQISVVNLLGETVIPPVIASNKRQVLNVAELSDGAYVVKITIGKIDYYQRFNKVR